MINTARKYRLRRLAALVILAILLAVIALVANLIYGFVKQEKSDVFTPEPTMPPVSAEGFDAANLISETEFTRWDSLSARQIQDFITDWGYGCRPGKAKEMPENTGISKATSGSDKQQVAVPCLKDFRGRLAPHDADRYCPQAVQGGEELNAGEIIAQVSRSCQINPKVILVTLQKEQGLITVSSARLTPTRYQIAMGYACPDHKLCDRQFFGFGTQVYYGARQLRRYQADPQEYLVQAGKPVTLGFGPDSRCNSGEITAQNWPTAALYNYTPYLASEDALAGLSHECAQAGNLNFYKFYKAWFGDPVTGNGEVLTRKALKQRQAQQKVKSTN
ncbi:hypothetical protein [Varibaculum prostatecancerukia]|uniref:hypothetical protein n=1 Tax=Varibaculum prostatecancerukia TaxID=2811781 RepID=UPI001BFFDB30|nr:hypothetical protein [Varibaculum prostatecancerukia]